MPLEDRWQIMPTIQACGVAERDLSLVLVARLERATY